MPIRGREKNKKIAKRDVAEDPWWCTGMFRLAGPLRNEKAVLLVLLTTSSKTENEPERENHIKES